MTLDDSTAQWALNEGLARAGTGCEMHQKRHDENDRMISALVFIGHRERIDSEWWLGLCLKKGDILLFMPHGSSWSIME